MQSQQETFQTILKQGYLEKQSKFLKEYRKRWMVLTPFGIYSFKNQMSECKASDFKSPTESIPLKDCSTIKSAEDEVHRENAFRLDCQSNRIFYFVAPSSGEKESWIGAIGKTMVNLKPSRRDPSDDEEEDDE